MTTNLQGLAYHLTSQAKDVMYVVLWFLFCCSFVVFDLFLLVRFDLMLFIALSMWGLQTNLYCVNKDKEFRKG